MFLIRHEVLILLSRGMPLCQYQSICIKNCFLLAWDGWALDFLSCWMSIKPSAQFCVDCPRVQLLFVAMEEECWHLWATCVVLYQRAQAKGNLSANSPGQVPTPCATTLSPYIYFIVSLCQFWPTLTKGKNNKSFLPAAGLWRVTASHSTGLRQELLVQWGQLLFCVGGGWCVEMCNSVW